jgi:chemotaxis methyl-accepting protein methylase
MKSSNFQLESITTVKDYVQKLSTMLDPNSRYINELLLTIDNHESIESLDSYLTRSSRPALQIGSRILEQMALSQKLYANLVTPETYINRFSEQEISYLKSFYIKRQSLGNATKIASVPCSIGLEPLSIARILWNHELKNSFTILGIDKQECYFKELSRGQLPAYLNTNEISFPIGMISDKRHKNRLSAELFSLLSFKALDIFEDSLPHGYDLIFCRNLLGFFRSELQIKALNKISAMLVKDGVLCLDLYVLTQPHAQELHHWLDKNGFKNTNSSIPTFFHRYGGNSI